MLFLLDNGSRRPAATRNLRRLAHHLGEQLGTEVQPVSAKHSSDIPPEALDGMPAQTLEPFLRAQVAAGEHRFGIVPLFFGPSRAISAFVPEVAGRVAAEVGPLEVRVADALCPLPAGEPLLVEILADQVRKALPAPSGQAVDVLLVDHGSPLPAVTAVRHWLAEGLAAALAATPGAQMRVGEAVMERREGAEYAFNGRLLAEALAELGAAASAEQPRQVVLAMQFISPGRHAGPGGDIAEIVAEAEAAHPGLEVHITDLIGEHPRFVDLLARRVAGLETRAPIELQHM
jgi:sirohydrochlorin ferrochelatase